MIKTWEERCVEHPDHQTGMVSHTMIQARMQEEIDDLRAAVFPGEEDEQEPVAWGCFRNGVLLDDLVSDEASVDYWCASDEPEMQKLVKRALYTHPPQRKPLTDDRIDMLLNNERPRWATSPPTYEFAAAFARVIERAHGIGGEHEA